MPMMILRFQFKLESALGPYYLASNGAIVSTAALSSVFRLSDPVGIRKEDAPAAVQAAVVNIACFCLTSVGDGLIVFSHQAIRLPAAVGVAERECGLRKSWLLSPGVV